MTLEEEIKHALKEARMLHLDDSKNELIETAMKLSGAPYSFVLQVYEKEELDA